MTETRLTRLLDRSQRHAPPTRGPILSAAIVALVRALRRLRASLHLTASRMRGAPAAERPAASAAVADGSHAVADWAATGGAPRRAARAPGCGAAAFLEARAHLRRGPPRLDREALKAALGSRTRQVSLAERSAWPGVVARRPRLKPRP